MAVADPWTEIELKLKGDRISDAAKLSWSFRGGTKLHGNHDVTDVVYLGLRRSRLDYEEGNWLIANSGIEYRYDSSLRGKPLRHYLLVDKKLPFGRGKAALVLGAGILWEAKAAYTGALSTGHDTLQFMLQPKVIF